MGATAHRATDAWGAHARWQPLKAGGAVAERRTPGARHKAQQRDGDHKGNETDNERPMVE